MKRRIFPIIGWIKANIKLFIIFLALFLAPFLFIRNAYEIATMILPMYGNEYVGIIAWIGAGKPFWHTGLAAGSVTGAGLIFLFLGINLGKILLVWFKNLLARKGFWQKPFFRKIGRYLDRIKWKKKNPEEKRIGFSKKFGRWVSRQGIWVVYLLCLVPIPYFGVIAVALTNIKSQKYGLWILLAVNFARNLLTVWAFYAGFGFLLNFLKFSS